MLELGHRVNALSSSAASTPRPEAEIAKGRETWIFRDYLVL